jgi:hypothetical protein
MTYTIVFEAILTAGAQIFIKMRTTIGLTFLALFYFAILYGMFHAIPSKPSDAIGFCILILILLPIPERIFWILTIRLPMRCYFKNDFFWFKYYFPIYNFKIPIANTNVKLGKTFFGTNKIIIKRKKGIITWVFREEMYNLNFENLYKVF